MHQLKTEHMHKLKTDTHATIKNRHIMHQLKTDTHASIKNRHTCIN